MGQANLGQWSVLHHGYFEIQAVLSQLKPYIYIDLQSYISVIFIMMNDHSKRFDNQCMYINMYLYFLYRYHDFMHQWQITIHFLMLRFQGKKSNQNKMFGLGIPWNFVKLLPPNNFRNSVWGWMKSYTACLLESVPYAVGWGLPLQNQGIWALQKRRALSY